MCICITQEVIRREYQVILKRTRFLRSVNDIALLRLKKSIVFSDVVSPACLNPERLEKNRDEKLIVSGWGRTEKSELYHCDQES